MMVILIGGQVSFVNQEIRKDEGYELASFALVKDLYDVADDDDVVERSLACLLHDY